MTKSKKSKFTKDDLVKLILSLDKNANIFYASGFSSHLDFIVRSNINKKKELFDFLRNYENEDNMIFIYYNDGSYYIQRDSYYIQRDNEKNEKNEWIRTTNKQKSHLDDIKRWFLRDSLETITECQLCCREIVHFKNPRMFQRCYHGCYRCGYMQCIECLYNLKKNDKGSECVQCKHKYELNMNTNMFRHMGKDHSTFLRHLHQNMLNYFINHQMSSDEFEKWNEINESTIFDVNFDHDF